MLFASRPFSRPLTSLSWARDEKNTRLASSKLSLALSVPAAASITSSMACWPFPASAAICPWLKRRIGKRWPVTAWLEDAIQPPSPHSSTATSRPFCCHNNRCLTPSRFRINSKVVSAFKPPSSFRFFATLLKRSKVSEGSLLESSLDPPHDDKLGEEHGLPWTFLFLDHRPRH